MAAAVGMICTDGAAIATSNCDPASELAMRTWYSLRKAKAYLNEALNKVFRKLGFGIFLRSEVLKHMCELLPEV